MVSDRTKGFKLKMAQAAGPPESYPVFVELLGLARSKYEGPNLDTLWQDINRAYQRGLLSDNEFDDLRRRMP